MTKDMIIMHDLSAVDKYAKRNSIKGGCFQIYSHHNDKGNVNACSIRFSSESEFVKEKMFFMNIAENRLTGEMFLVFSQSKGAVIGLLGREDSKTRYYGTSITSVVKFIAEQLKLDWSNDLNITVMLGENVSKLGDVLTYKIERP